MGRSKETFGKKEVRNKQIKKRKDKEKRRLEKKEQDTSSFDDMLAWVDENGQLCSAPPDLSNKKEVKAENIEVSVPKGGNSNVISVYTGMVKNFDESKGFGFISSRDLNDSVFVHVNDCNGELKTGMKVEFEIESGEKGLKAKNIKFL